MNTPNGIGPRGNDIASPSGKPVVNDPLALRRGIDDCSRDPLELFPANFVGCHAAPLTVIRDQA